MKVNANNFSAAMIGLIEDRLEAKHSEAVELIDEMADELAAELQKISAEKFSKTSLGIKKKRRKVNYAKGWIVDGYSGNRIIRNKNAPTLTHLLENGSYLTGKRQTKGKGKKYWVPANRGKMLAKEHIFPTFEKVKTKYMKKFHEL